jgi:hypothetical protein
MQYIQLISLSFLDVYGWNLNLLGSGAGTLGPFTPFLLLLGPSSIGAKHCWVLPLLVTTTFGKWPHITPTKIGIKKKFEQFIISV